MRLLLLLSPSFHVSYGIILDAAGPNYLGRLTTSRGNLVGKDLGSFDYTGLDVSSLNVLVSLI